jgi:hypothetical protein
MQHVTANEQQHGCQDRNDSDPPRCVGEVAQRLGLLSSSKYLRIPEW